MALRVSSSLESKSESFSRGAERFVVVEPSVATCCLSISAAFSVGFLLLDGFCVEGALSVRQRENSCCQF